MKYNNSDQLLEAYRQAKQEARRLGHDYVGADHLMLGVIAADPDAIGPDAEDVRQEVLHSLGPGRRPFGNGEFPYSAGAKKVMVLSMERARQDGSEAKITTKHLLHGLAAEGTSNAAHILINRRTEAAANVGGVDGGAAALALKIDDDADRSIYEQIVEQIREAVATGRVRAGERLPPVRRLADELDIAPGTVARAYSELERLKIVATQGSRGTRVAEPAKAGLAEGERAETLAGLLRPVVVAGFHLGADAGELRSALDHAMADIFTADG